MLKAGAVIGVMGGGQLARMFAMKAAQYGYHVHIYSDVEDCPAKEVAGRITVASYEDSTALQVFCDAVDVVTVEFENIPAFTAHYAAERVPFYPAPELFAICRDRGKEKAFIASAEGKTAPYALAHTDAELAHAVAKIGLPCIVKTTTEGYDGKGQFRINTHADLENVWAEAGNRPLIIEAFVDFASEASVLIARDTSGRSVLFPITDNVHHSGILHQSTVPTATSAPAQQNMQDTAIAIAEKAQLQGLLAIEFFVLHDSTVLVNEMAPRPHNSGHWTMDGCNVCQFEQLLRVCVGMPLKTPHILAPTTMTNLIGDDVMHLAQHVQDDYARVHVYGKKQVVSGRKMGHVNRLTLQ
jgi:5-(carboxyamino)imidazole ribonucleotide synthase